MLSDITLYVYIGGKGTDASPTESKESPGGFNGGGVGGTDIAEPPAGKAGGGGGGTDIRLIYGNISSRLIVAGGGASGDSVNRFLGGYGPAGGGLVGESKPHEEFLISGSGGSQTEGGKAENRITHCSS